MKTFDLFKIMTHKKNSKLVCILVITMALFSKPLLGGDTLNVGIYKNRPKLYIDQQGNPAGIYVFLLNHIAEKENWHLNYKLCKWDECILALHQGKVDLLPDMAHTNYRDSIFEFNEICVLESWSKVYSRKKIKIQNLKDLENKRIATLRGSVHEKELKFLMKGYGYDFTLIKVSSFEEAFSEASIGVADVAVTNHFYGETHYQFYNLEKTPVVFNPVKLYFATQKGKHNEILQTIDMYLEEWKKTPNSFYYKTLRKHGTIPADQEKQHSHLFYFIAIAGAIVVSGLVIYFLRRNLLTKKNDLEKNSEILKEENKKLKQYFESAPYGIFITNYKGQLIEANQAAVKNLDFKKTELLHMAFIDLVSKNHKEQAKDHFAKTINEGKASGVYPIKIKNGDIRLWEIDTVKINEMLIIGFVLDITEHELKDEQLLKLKKKLETEVADKTEELNQHIQELEHFREVTIEREIRMEELRKEIKKLRKELNSNKSDDN